MVKKLDLGAQNRHDFRILFHFLKNPVTKPGWKLLGHGGFSHMDLTSNNSTNSGCDHQFFRNLRDFTKSMKMGGQKL